MIIFPIIMFVLSVIAAGAGVLLLATGLTNALLAFLISAVLFTGAFIIGALLDVEKAIKDKSKPPPLPR
jgi:hypothetical protein